MIQYRFIMAMAFLSCSGFYYFVPRIFSRKARSRPEKRIPFADQKEDRVSAESASNTKAIQELNRLLQDAQSKNRMMEEELETTKHQIKELSKVNSDIATMDAEKEKKYQEEMEELIEILTRERTKELNLMGEIQMICRRAVEEKFGQGPYRVEITLDFPPEQDKDKENPTKFIIEMAPLDYMPHSVYLFLQQVSRNLWDGCSFHRNARHVIQAGPLPYHHGNTTAEPLPNKYGEFRANFLLGVSFQEYHQNYPHEQFTVGFAGRPGGPDWYISITNNTINHGPGGQSGYGDQMEADPCFGRVVDGLDAVKRLHTMPVKPGEYNAMQNNVGIKSARILQSNS